MSADRDRGARLAEIEAAIDEDGVCLDSDEARDLLRAAGEGDRLRRDLAALAEEWERRGYSAHLPGALRDLLDGGEGGR